MCVFIFMLGNHEWCDCCRTCVWDTGSYSSYRNSTLPTPSAARGVQVKTSLSSQTQFTVIYQELLECILSCVCFNIWITIFLCYSSWMCRLHVCACLSGTLHVYICVWECMFVWNSKREPGTKEPVELDCVSQGKGGYLALGHKHSSLSPAKATQICHSGSMKNILPKQKNVLNLSGTRRFFFFFSTIVIMLWLVMGTG